MPTAAVCRWARATAPSASAPTTSAGRGTDHRIGLTLYRLNDILEGDLDEIITALTLAEQAALMEKQQ